MPNTFLELEQLKNAIYLFLKLTGGPSEQLCHYLLKIIDFLPSESIPCDSVNNKQEITELTHHILISIGTALVERTYSNSLKHKLQAPATTATNEILLQAIKYVADQSHKD